VQGLQKAFVGIVNSFASTTGLSASVGGQRNFGIYFFDALIVKFIFLQPLTWEEWRKKSRSSLAAQISGFFKTSFNLYRSHRGPPIKFFSASLGYSAFIGGWILPQLH